MLLGYPSPEDSQLHIVPAVADKSVETAFYVQDDWKVTPKLTLNLGLRYEWSTPYSERFNQLQFSDFTGDTGISYSGDRNLDPANPQFNFGQIGDLLGTTVFATIRASQCAGGSEQLCAPIRICLPVGIQHSACAEGQASSMA